MAIVLDDLPPLMWHAELGRSLPDLWSGTHHRGVQLHDLRDAVLQWGHRYGQQGWLRQLQGPVDREMEDAGAAGGRPAGRHAVPVDGPARRSLAAWAGCPAAPAGHRGGGPATTGAGRWRRRTAPRSWP